MMARKVYPTDLTDAEWEQLQPLIPPGKADQGGRGRKRQVDVREVVNAIFYWADSGCKWKLLPHDLPPRSTVFEYFTKWQRKGIWQKINDTLRQEVRQKEGRAADPSLGILDSQSVKAQKGALCPAGAAEKRVMTVIKKSQAEKDTSW